MDKKKVMFYWLLVLLWMATIFCFSSKPAQQSDTQSLFVIELINKAVNSFGVAGHLFGIEWNYPVRKVAHASEYAVLGVLLFLALSSMKIEKKKRLFAISMIICITYAASDEIHQLFVPGRACRFFDVIIDALGGLAGLTLSYLSHRRAKYKSLFRRY